MTTVIRRRGLLLVLVSVLGLLLSSCASGPSQVNAAAIVDGKTIGVDRVQELVEKALKAEPAAQVLADQRKLDLLSRAILRQLVLHELVEDYATKQGVTVDPAQVAELSTQLTQSLTPLPTDGTAAPERIVDQAVNRAFDAEFIARDYLLLARIGNDQAARLSVTFDFVLVAPGSTEQTGSLREQAVAKARQLAEAGPDGATRIIDAEIAAGAQAAKGEKITPVQGAEIAGTALFGTPANSVVAFQPNQENAGWVVALIRERDTNAAPAEDTTAQPDPRLATTLGPRLLQQTAVDLGVQISPRYGVWDLAAMAIAPSEAETTGVIIPVSGAATP